MIGERHAAAGQGIGMAIGLVPVPRRVFIERGVEIIAQRGSERVLIAGTGPHRIEGGRDIVLQRAGEQTLDGRRFTRQAVVLG